MKKIIVFVCIIILIPIVLQLINNGERTKVELDKCVDGDTAWFKINNKRKKYRFLAIDTMELDTEFGVVTSEYVCNLLNVAKDIEIEYSKFGESKDKYNRELVFVFLDNELLQEKLIEKGYARLKYIYAKYEYLDNLIEIEKNSMKKKIGIWKYQSNNKYEYNILENSKKTGCKFIGWQYNNRLYDMTNKIKNINLLKPKFDC